MNNCRVCGRFAKFDLCKRCFTAFPTAENVDSAENGEKILIPDMKKTCFIIKKAQ